MEEGLFEKAFREKKQEFGIFDKPIISKENKKVIQKPMKQTSQQGTTVINVYTGSKLGQGYTRPMRIPQKPRTRKAMPKQQEYIVTKAQAEQGLKMAKSGAKKAGKGAKKVVGSLRKKTRREQSPYGKKEKWLNK